MNQIAYTQQLVELMIENVEKVVVGKRKIVEKMLVALFAGGHILFEDVPGVGKTLLVKILSQTIGSDFKRIQFTPDLLPTDIIGMSIYNQKTLEFEFKPGPIMANILLADEINRTSPKTQSALLEAMEEKTVTVDGVTYNLNLPFIVMATQNPVEYEGTFPLPEAQMDRFMMKLHLGYPEKQDELKMLDRQDHNRTLDIIEPVCAVEDILQIQEIVKNIYVDDGVKEYVVDICQKTRVHEAVLLGVSPRGTMALYRAVQALAYMRKRDYVLPDDVKALVYDTLSHRLILKSDALMDGVKAMDVVTDILQRVSVPVLRAGK